MMLPIRLLQAVAVSCSLIQPLYAQGVMLPPYPYYTYSVTPVVAPVVTMPAPAVVAPVTPQTVAPVPPLYKVGDRLIVVAQAEIRTTGNPPQILGRGQDVRVDGVSGNLLLVKNVTAGWIRQELVATPAVAVSIFTDQIAWDPWDAGAYYARGIARENLNRYNAAIVDFNTAISLDPLQSCAFIGRGNCYAMTGDPAKAILDYTEALRLNPDSPIALANRAKMWNVTGEFAKAVDDANAALLITPNYASAYSARAVAYAGTRQYEFAMADCDRIATISTPGTAGYNDVAWFLAMAPDPNIRNGAKAVEFATKASKFTNGIDGAVLDTLAVASAEAADFTQAVAFEQKAIDVSSDRDRVAFEIHLRLFQSSRTLLESQVTSSPPPPPAPATSRKTEPQKSRPKVTAKPLLSARVSR